MFSLEDILHGHPAYHQMCHFWCPFQTVWSNNWFCSQSGSWLDCPEGRNTIWTHRWPSGLGGHSVAHPSRWILSFSPSCWLHTTREIFLKTLDWTRRDLALKQKAKQTSRFLLPCPKSLCSSRLCYSSGCGADRDLLAEAGRLNPGRPEHP